MGTYHPIANSTDSDRHITSAKKNKRNYKPRTILSYDETAAILEQMVAEPRLSLGQLSRQHGLGNSTVSNWFIVQPNKVVGRKPLRNFKVAEWMQDSTDGINNLARFQIARPKQRIDQQIKDEGAAIVNKDDKVATHLQADNLNPQKPFAVTEHGVFVAGTTERMKRLGIGTFRPATTDDLLVVRGEAQAVKDEVLAIADMATRLVDAIALVREALTTSDQLKIAMGRIDHYESRIKELEFTLERFRQSKLASNQVHSRD